VGSVSAACLAAQGHDVVGVDVSPTKVDMIREGCSPVIEAGLEELIRDGVASGRLRATMETESAVRDTDISLLCVGTPSNGNGSIDLQYVRRVSEEIGLALAAKGGHHIVVARSTMLPGSTERVVIPAIEHASGRCVGQDFGVGYNPEFLREGTSLADFQHPPFTIIGGEDPQVEAAMRELYARIDGPLLTVPYRVAEILKYASNAYHALKVTFANEIASICKSSEIDSHLVMDLFCRDDKLNISPAYLRPGFAFGGSCLPKDLRALLHHSHSRDVFPPVLEAILPSNRRQIDAAYEAIRSSGRRRVGVLGFTFKAGTDDLRESPLVELIERLIGKGFSVRVYDRNVSLASLHGANRAYIEQEIPHIASLMCQDIDDVLTGSDIVVVGNADPAFRAVLDRLRPDQRLLELVRMTADARNDPRYEGIAW
jgi:GDP-mannose 6-dehydrogenase